MDKRNKKIDFYRPPVGKLEKAAITGALASGWLTSGPECAHFEEEMREFLGRVSGMKGPPLTAQPLKEAKKAGLGRVTNTKQKD